MLRAKVSAIRRAFPPESRNADIRIGPGSRCVRGWLDVRGADCSAEVGAGSNIEGTVVLERSSASVVIGDRTHIGGGTLLDVATSIRIGSDVLISFGVMIVDHDSHSLDFAMRRDDVRLWMAGQKNWTHVPMRSVTIGDCAWVGAKSTVLKGVSLGEGAVVAASAVVTRDVPPWTLVGGNPARVIRELPR